MNSMQKNSRRAAFCGVLAALAVVLLVLGGMLPLALYSAPLLAMLCTLPVLAEYGSRTALLFYAAVSLLGIMCVPDREVTLLYLFLGWYPTVRPVINRRLRTRLGRCAVKLVLFCLAISAMYWLEIHLLGMQELAAEYAAAGTVLLGIMLMLSCVIWLLFDRILERFAALYLRRWRGQSFRCG